MQLPLDGGFSESSAYGTNDRGDIVVGTFGSDWSDNRPVIWSGSGWAPQQLDPVSGYAVGEAFDVNDDGSVAGTSIGPTDSGLPGTVATVWHAGSLDGTPLPSALGGTGRAFAISNAGYVVGESRTENPNSPPWHATLWRPPYGDMDVCDLHLQAGLDPSTRSVARGVTDLAEGKVLVVGWWEYNAVVWDVDVTTCAVLSHEIGHANAFDVAVVAGNWEVVGVDESSRSGWPARWLRSSGTGTFMGTTLADNRGYALGINDAGWIVGWTFVKGKERAWLWVPTTQ